MHHAPRKSNSSKTTLLKRPQGARTQQETRKHTERRRVVQGRNNFFDDDDRVKLQQLSDVSWRFQRHANNIARPGTRERLKYSAVRVDPPSIINIVTKLQAPTKTSCVSSCSPSNWTIPPNTTSLSPSAETAEAAPDRGEGASTPLIPCPNSPSGPASTSSHPAS